MPTENTTVNRGYQLPAQGNNLVFDVARIIAALVAIDSDVAGAIATAAAKAGLDSPIFTGNPQAPTQVAGDESNKIATTAFVAAAVAALVESAPGTLDTLNELAAALGDDPNFAATTAAALALRLRVDAAQGLTVLQKGQARANMDAHVLAGMRNKLINGAGGLIQRGSTTVAAGSSKYVFDRWFVTNDTDQTVTVSQNQLSLGSGFAIGGRHSMRYNFASAPTTGTLRIEQRIEDVTSVIPGDWTLTAWMSGPSGSEALAAEVVQSFGTGGSPSSDVTTAMTFAGDSPTTIYDASTNRRCWGVTVPSLAGKLLGTGNDDYLATAMVLTPRQSGNYDLTWLSFVEGDASSESDPSSPRHVQQEVALCQRYYCKTYELDVDPGTASAGGRMVYTVVATGSNWATWYYPQFMRGLPTIVTYSPISGTPGKVNVSGGDGDVNSKVSIVSKLSTPISNDGTLVSSGSGATIQYHATADAEL